MTTANLKNLVAERLERSVIRAGEIADRDPAGTDLGAQLDLEGALDDVERYARTSEAVSVVRVRSEPLTYEREGRHSFFKDVIATTERSNPDAKARLDRHRHEMTVENRAGSTDAAAGGTFVPPLWVLDQFLPAMRAGRVVADLAVNIPLPTGTDVLNIPTITTGTKVAVQATENTAVTARDIVTGSTTADVTTIAGIYDASLPLAELSGWSGGYDALVLKDMTADYDRKINSLILYGTGTNNQNAGITVGAFTSVTVTTAAVTAFYSALGDGANRLQAARQKRPEVIVMHPRRWWWLTTRLDTGGVPVVQQDPDGAVQLLERFGIEHSGHGIVGHVAGTPIAIDDTVSTTTADHHDDVVLWRPTDALLYESAPTLYANRIALAADGAVRFTFHRYVAFSMRTGNAAATLSGAGLTGPTW